jgi:hypothetical protein
MSTKGVLTVERLPRFLLYLEGMAAAAAAPSGFKDTHLQRV